MAERVGGSSSGRTRGSGPRSGGSNPPPPANPSVPPARPHRLEAQDTALSRLKHGFESRWGHQANFAGFLLVSRIVRLVSRRRGIPRNTPESPPEVAAEWQRIWRRRNDPRRTLRPSEHEGADDREPGA